MAQKRRAVLVERSNLHVRYPDLVGLLKVVKIKMDIFVRKTRN